MNIERIVKITHEMPLSLSKLIGFGDYMYVLLHKYLEHEGYRDYVDSIQGDTVVYLDNSAFELGESLDNKVLYDAFKRIKPSVVILPDVLGEKDITITRTQEFLNEYPDTHDYSMAVIQGNSPEEMIECYKVFDSDPRIKYIAIPFVYSWAEKIPHVQANERQLLLAHMNTHVINKDRKHHLLGTWWANEFNYYRDYEWVYSVDTSNPVMAALDGKRYTPGRGVVDKPYSKFDTVIDLQLEQIDVDMVKYNIKQFKEIVNGSCQ